MGFEVQVEHIFARAWVLRDIHPNDLIKTSLIAW